MLTIPAKPSISSTFTSNVGTAKTQPQLTQSNIKAKIEQLGVELNKLPIDTDPSEYTSKFTNLINEIKSSPEHDHVSSLFGAETTNKEENLYLLNTVVDSANISDSNKKNLVNLLKKELAISVSVDSYFRKAPTIEEKVIANLPSQAKKSNEWKTDEVSFFSVVADAGNLRIQDAQFIIENTSGMAHNCLAYSLQKNNASLSQNYRTTTFIPENIKAQLIKIQNNYDQNEHQSNDGMSAFDVLLETVKANYDMTINASIKDVDSLSKALANHVQQTNCMLDGPIAGGIFASTSKQPIIFVKQNPNGELVFNVLDKEGILIHQGDSLETVPASLLNNAKYVHNSNGLHFERMVRVST